MFDRLTGINLNFFETLTGTDRNGGVFASVRVTVGYWLILRYSAKRLNVLGERLASPTTSKIQPLDSVGTAVVDIIFHAERSLFGSRQRWSLP